MTSNGPEIKIPVNNTRTEILQYLLSEDFNALELKEKLGINESAIRRHLNILEQEGYIEHYFEKASRGRPKKLFKLTNKGKKLFPKQNQMILAILTNKIREHCCQDDIEEILDNVAKEIEEELSIEIKSKNLEDKLEELKNTFNELGFFTKIFEEDDSYILEYRNCPFSQVNEDLERRLCGMHRKVVRETVGNKEINLEDWIFDGDKVCRQRIMKK